LPGGVNREVPAQAGIPPLSRFQILSSESIEIFGKTTVKTFRP